MLSDRYEHPCSLLGQHSCEDKVPKESRAHATLVDHKTYGPTCPKSVEQAAPSAKETLTIVLASKIKRMMDASSNGQSFLLFTLDPERLQYRGVCLES